MPVQARESVRLAGALTRMIVSSLGMIMVAIGAVTMHRAFHCDGRIRRGNRDGLVSEATNLFGECVYVNAVAMGHGHCSGHNRNLDVCDVVEATYSSVDLRGAACAIHALDPEAGLAFSSTYGWSPVIQEQIYKTSGGWRVKHNYRFGAAC